jgi:F-type H+-transporting ATPase subunit b
VKLQIVSLLLILAVAPAVLIAQRPENQQPNAVAHGAEKPHEEPRFIGLPYWIWKLINMLLFFGFLAWVLGGPVKRAFANRGEEIRREADEARERRAKADAMARDIQSRLARLDDELRAILERAKAEGERQKEEMIAEAKAEAQKILQAARGEVDNRIKHARHELTEYAGELATQRAENILREKITDEDRRKLFAESVHAVEEAQS